MTRRPYVLVSAASVLAFLSSLALPAVHVTDAEVALLKGHYMFLWGGLGPFVALPHWYANLAWAFALWWMRKQRYRAACIAGLCGAALAGHFLSYRELPWWRGGSSMDLTVTSFGSGYWLWLSSFVLIAVAALLGMKGEAAASRGDAAVADDAMDDRAAVAPPAEQDTRT